MILTGPQILEEVKAGQIHIDGFDPSGLEPNSYAFRLGEDIMWYESGVIDSYEVPPVCRKRIPPEGVVLEPDRLYLGVTVEAMGSSNHAATLYACRSVSTLGMWIQFSAPLGHAGAVFPWTLEIKVAMPVRVFAGMVIGKIAFWTMRGTPIQYSGRYTGSTSVVASRLSLDTGLRQMG